VDRLPHSFREPSLRSLALTHSSADSAVDNERLEFLGDAVLGLLVTEELYARHPDLSEGDLTELRAWVVSRKVLAEAARHMGLEEAARVGSGMRGRALPRSVLANLYEALLGAVHLDGGLEAARTFMLATLATWLERVHSQRTEANPKQALQHLSQQATGEPPAYLVLDERGRAHARAFLVSAQTDGRRFPAAWGRTLKEAERWAAHEALLVLDAEREQGGPTTSGGGARDTP